MNSQHYHTMQSILAEIDTFDEKIFQANTHCNLTKNSILNESIKDMEVKRTALLDKLDKHLSAWMEKITEA